MSFILNIFKGIIIGAGAILPGISSGVLCVILGIYESIISRILHFFKNFKENILFFLPLIIGGTISAVFISKGLLFLLENYTVPTSYCFIGLILGCLPAVFKYSNSVNSNSKSSTFLKYLFLALTFSFSIYLLALENFSSFNSYENTELSFFELIRNGILMSAGVVIPGVSNTVILMLLNSYNIYLEALSTLNFSILIPMGIGLVIGGVLLLKVIEFLFSKYKTYTYYAIIGFTIGSAFILVPSFTNITETLYGFAFMIISFFASYKLSSMDKS